MREWSGGEESGGSGGWDLPFETSDPALRPWLRRFGRDLHLVLQNEIDTRRVLAEEVYRVPDHLLDDVIRVRMADLDRGDV